MRPNKTFRRTFLAAAATAVATASGCTGIKDGLSGRKVRRQTDLTGQSDREYLENQPTFESAPAAESWLVTDPGWMETNIRWEQLDGEKSRLRQIQGNIDSGTFLTVSVGALPYRYGLGGFGDSYIEGRTIQLNTKVKKTIIGGQGDQSDPAYAYDYWFILWRLLNNTKQPTEMDFNFRLGELSTDSPGRSAE